MPCRYLEMRCLGSAIRMVIVFYVTIFDADLDLSNYHIYVECQVTCRVNRQSVMHRP